MDDIDLSITKDSFNQCSRLDMIRDLIMNHKGDFSIDLLIDIFQNLILDCKSLPKCNSNKYLNNFYQKYEMINEKLYRLRIKKEDFNMLKVIGQGASGQVQLVRHCQTGKLFALKIMNKTQMKSQESSISWREERDILIKVDSNWIVKLYYAFQDPRRLYLVMEYLPGGNLVNWMSRLEDIAEAEVCFYTAEIVLAVCALHQYNIVHRDLKPDNMLLDIRGHIKLADFGSCTSIDPITKYVINTRAVGTPDYISPEVLLSQGNNSKYGSEVDWWALGVILYEIFYGDPPFYSETLITTYGKIMTHEQSLTFPLDDQVSDVAISLMKGLICDRSIRLGTCDSSKDIKSHMFFHSPNYKWNWDNIQEFEAPFIPNLENDWDTSLFDFTEDDDSDLFNGVNSKELISKVFSGDNLQFSGFSFSDIFSDFTLCQSKENVNAQLVPDTDTMIENENLLSKVNSLSKENVENKNSLEKLLIEKKDLEVQFQAISSKYKNEENISKKLQLEYSDLISKYDLSQQKLSKWEEEKQKLCEDMMNLQSTSTDESRRLLSQIEQYREDLNNLNTQLSDYESEYRRLKLQNIKLENDIKYMQKKYDSLKMEQLQVENSTEKIVVPQKLDDRFALELNKLQFEYEDKLSELENQIIENQSLRQTVTSLQKEKEGFKNCIMKKEEKLTMESEYNNKLRSLCNDSNSKVENLKSEIEKYRKRIDSANKSNNDLSQRMSRLIKAKVEDKQRYVNEIEDQRKKLNCIISEKNAEIQEMKKNYDLLADENNGLKAEVTNEKARCSVLVDKINEIISGKSSSAREMMIVEDMKNGLLGKRSGRYNNQVLKKNKKLESMYEQLEKDSLKKEKEFKSQIEALTREKDLLENENNSLKNDFELYENNKVNDSVRNNSYSSQNSFQSAYSNDLKKSSSDIRASRPPSKPLLMNFSQANNSVVSSELFSSKPSKMIDIKDNKEVTPQEVSFRLNKTKVLDFRRFSMTESLSKDFNLREGQLEVNVKTKGKKMSWEKRFVKIDYDNILFYDQALDTCFLKIPLSSLVLVRKAQNADIIHAKPMEISRIFQIIYDKTSTIYSEVLQKKSMSGSSSSVNTIASGKSIERESFIITDQTDTMVPDTSMKPAPRRNSLGNLFPKFKAKKATNKHVELTISSVNVKAVFLRGHVFQPFNSDLKVTCDICKTSLQNSTIVNKDLKVVVDRKFSIIQNTKDGENSSSTVDSTKSYTCYHCSMNVHGYDLMSKMNVCQQSVATQLCRASSEEQQLSWIKCIDKAINLRKMSVSTIGPSTDDLSFLTPSFRF